MNQWNVPDWREASAYPSSDLPKYLWRWEFLRRNTRYREDWKRHAEGTYQYEQRKQKSSAILKPTDTEFRASLAYLHDANVATIAATVDATNYAISTLKGNLGMIRSGPVLSPDELEELVSNMERLVADATTREQEAKAEQAEAERRLRQALQRVDEYGLTEYFLPNPAMRFLPGSPFRYVLDAITMGSLSTPREAHYTVREHQIAVLLNRTRPLNEQFDEIRRVSKLFPSQVKCHAPRIPSRAYSDLWPRYLRALDAKAAGAKQREIYTCLCKKIPHRDAAAGPEIAKRVTRLLKEAEDLTWGRAWRYDRFEA